MANYNYAYDISTTTSRANKPGSGSTEYFTTQFGTNGAQSYDGLYKKLGLITESGSVLDPIVWLTGFTCSIGGIQVVESKKTKVYFLFQAALPLATNENDKSWTTFADSRDIGDSIYLTFEKDTIYGVKFSFYGDKLKNNNNILYRMINATKGNLKIRCLCYDSTETGCHCYWGGSKVNMRFHYSMAEESNSSTISIANSDVIVYDNNYYISKEVQAESNLTNFIVNFFGDDPQSYYKYDGELQYKINAEEGWKTDSSVALPIVEYGGGQKNCFKRSSFTKDAPELYDIPFLTKKGQLMVHPKNLPSENGSEYKYRFIFKVVQSDQVGDSQEIEIDAPSIIRSYEQLNFKDSKIQFLGTQDTETLHLGNFINTEYLNIRISIEGIKSDSPENLPYIKDIPIIEVTKITLNDQSEFQNFSYNYDINNNELLLTLLSYNPIEQKISNIDITSTSLFSSEPKTVYSISPSYIEENVQLILQCTPGVIVSNGTETGRILKFYNNTIIQSISGSIEVFLASNNDSSIKITTIDDKKYQLLWNDGFEESSITIQTKVDQDYGTYNISSETIELKRTKLLNDIILFIQDANKKELNKETPDWIQWDDALSEFPFYDNLSFKFANSQQENPLEGELIEYSLFAYEINDNGQIIQKRTLCDALETNTGKISATIDELELLRTGGQIELILKDSYGQILTTPRLKVGQLRPINFTIEQYTINSTDLSLKLNPLDIVPSDMQFNISGSIYSTQETDINNHRCIFTKKEPLQEFPSGYINFTGLNFVVGKNSALISDLEKGINNSEFILLLELSNYEYPNCKSLYILRGRYNFSRTINFDNLKGLELALNGESRKPLYFNGGETVSFILQKVEDFYAAPYIVNSYTYENHYKPSVKLALAFENTSDYFEEQIKEEENLQISRQIQVNFPYSDIDILKTLKPYIVMKEKQYIPFSGEYSKSFTYNVACWREIPLKPVIESLEYNFNDNTILANLTLDPNKNGSATYNNNESVEIEIFDEANPNKIEKLTWNEDSNFWTGEYNISNTKSNIGSSDFYNFIIKVTYTNIAKNSKSAISDVYSISKLIDLTIRRGRIGINVPQDFNYDIKEEEIVTNTDGSETKIVKHLTPTLEIRQRESTQIDQLETIKIVSCKNKADDSLGPMIGFYSADNQCYGHISANSGKLLVMTIEEVQNLFNTMTEV